MDGKRIEEESEFCLYVEAMIQLKDWASREEIAAKMDQIASVVTGFRRVPCSRLDRLEDRCKDKRLESVIISVTGKGTRIRAEFTE